LDLGSDTPVRGGLLPQRRASPSRILVGGVLLEPLSYGQVVTGSAVWRLFVDHYCCHHGVLSPCVCA
jgi:hypothetical protein